VLTRPEDAVFSNVPAAIKVVEIAEGRDRSRDKESGVLRCVQKAGDVIVVPAQWGHLTYNLRTSIGLAKEFNLVPDFQGKAQESKNVPEKTTKSTAFRSDSTQQPRSTQGRDITVESTPQKARREEEGAQAATSGTFSQSPHLESRRPPIKSGPKARTPQNLNTASPRAAVEEF